MKSHLTNLSACLLLVCGCSTANVAQYSKNEPKLDMVDYFTGNVRGWGVVLNRSGELASRFTVDIKGTPDGKGNLVMDEDFFWSNGEKTKRIWTISRKGKHGYSGTAGDVIGKATGEAHGNVLNWTYLLALKLEGSTWKIRFDDWMWLQPDGILLNKAEMKKFGLHVGQVIIAFQKQGDRE